MSFVLLRSFVRKIIHFCEGEMEGPRIVLPTGTLTHRFFGVRKVDPKLALATDPFLDGKKLLFWKKVQKVDMGFYREERVPKSHCFELTLVASRRKKCSEMVFLMR